MKTILRKLSSRKLWVAVAGFVSGLILAFGGAESTAATVGGIIMQGASVLGYLLAEGLVDAAAVGEPEQIIADAEAPDISGTTIPGGDGE